MSSNYHELRKSFIKNQLPVIEPHLFKVFFNNEWNIVNEYELRAIQVMVKDDLLPTDTKVMDCKGSEFTINKEGRISGRVFGMSITYDITLELLE